MTNSFLRGICAVNYHSPFFKNVFFSFSEYRPIVLPFSFELAFLQQTLTDFLREKVQSPCHNAADGLQRPQRRNRHLDADSTKQRATKQREVEAGGVQQGAAEEKIEQLLALEEQRLRAAEAEARGQEVRQAVASGAVVQDQYLGAESLCCPLSDDECALPDEDGCPTNESVQIQKQQVPPSLPDCHCRTMYLKVAA